MKTSRTTVTVNGQTYNSVDEMPPDVRKQYEQALSMLADRDGNGIPDILEGKSPGVSRTTRTGNTIVTEVSNVSTTSIDLNGQPLPRAPADPSPSSPGLTIHITLPTILKLAIAVLIGLVVAWYFTK